MLCSFLSLFHTFRPGDNTANRCSIREKGKQAFSSDTSRTARPSLEAYRLPSVKPSRVNGTPNETPAYASTAVVTGSSPIYNLPHGPKQSYQASQEPSFENPSHSIPNYSSNQSSTYAPRSVTNSPNTQSIQPNTPPSLNISANPPHSYPNKRQKTSEERTYGSSYPQHPRAPPALMTGAIHEEDNADLIERDKVNRFTARQPSGFWRPYQPPSLSTPETSDRRTLKPAETSESLIIIPSSDSEGEIEDSKPNTPAYAPYRRLPNF